MIQPPTPEELAREILDRCAALGRRPGDFLPLKPLWQWGAQQGWRQGDLEAGIKQGVENGWWYESPDDPGQFLLK